MLKNRTRNWLEHSPTLSEFLGHIESEFEGTYFRMFGFSLKSSLISNLNHSNRIRNDQVMVKIRTLVKTEHQWQNTFGTGTALFDTGTTPRIFPRMVVFLPIFHILLPKSTQ